MGKQSQSRVELHWWLSSGGRCRNIKFLECLWFLWYFPRGIVKSLRSDSDELLTYSLICKWRDATTGLQFAVHLDIDGSISCTVAPRWLSCGN